MWVFLNDAFISAVVDRRRPSRLLVRARHPGDLERFIPGCVVEETPTADYRYRTTVKRSTYRKALEAAEAAIDYDNFKASVRDAARHDAYLGCWTVLRRWQRDTADVPDDAEEREREAYMEGILGRLDEPETPELLADARAREKARVEDLFAAGMREAVRPEVESFEAYLRGEDTAAPDPRTRTQIDLFTGAPDPRASYAGRTFSDRLDRARLDTAQAKVLRALLTERWHTLPELRMIAGSAADSRVRDLRKPEFGGFEVQARRAPDFIPEREDPDDFTPHARRQVHDAAAWREGQGRAAGVWLYRIAPDSVTAGMVEAAARKLGLDRTALPTPTRRARAARRSAE